MVVPTPSAQYRWLSATFPSSTTHYVFCGNKSILRADFLIDDHPATSFTLRRACSILRRTIHGYRFTASITGNRSLSTFATIQD